MAGVVTELRAKLKTEVLGALGLEG
jgi:hypothetical protein